MIEALWAIQFRSNLGIFGSGVVVFETERIFGGDAKFYYLGSCKVNPNGLLEGNVEVIHYSGDNFSIFGHINNFQLRIKGKVQVPNMVLYGEFEGRPDLQIELNLRKIADLP